MQHIEVILLEPVGCLADFPSGPFHEIAARLFHKKGKPSKSGSREYWHMLNLMEAARKPDAEAAEVMRALESEAVAGARIYDDVFPALAELKAMGVRLSIASSLSREAVAAFLEAHSLSGFFSAVWSRDNAGGVKTAPLIRALQSARAKPQSELFLTDTAEGIAVAKTAGVNSILMMNDPDESRRLTAHNPAGGVVSLHELPDFVRLVKAQSAFK